MSSAEPTIRPAATRLLLEAALPVGFGVSLGLLVVAEAWIGRYHPLWDRLTGASMRQGFPWTLTALGLAIVGMILARRAVWIFDRRFLIAALAPVIASVVNGLRVVGNVDAFEFAFIFSLLVWLVISFVEERPIVTSRTAIVLLLGLVAGAVLSAVNGKMGSLMAMRALVAKIVVAFLISNLVRTPGELRAVLRTLIVLAVLSVVLAIVAQVAYATRGVIWSTEGSTMQFKSTPFGSMLRATAFCQNPQALGHFLIATLGVTLVAPMSRARRLGLGVLLCTGVVLTFSMGAILSMGVVLVAAPFVARPDRTLHYLAIGGGLFVLAYVTGAWEWFYDVYLQPAGAAGAEDRMERLREGLHVVARHPWLGIGLLNTQRVLTHPVHNTYAEVITEIGPFSLAFFVALLLYMGFSCVALARAHPDADARAVLRGLFLGLFGLVVHFHNNPMFLDVFSWSYIGIMMSAVIVLGRQRLEPGNDHAT